MTDAPNMSTWPYADAQHYMRRVREGFPPLMICVAVNGGIQGKETNPALPETPAEIAQATWEAARAGASMVHVHARDRNHQTLGSRTERDWIEVVDAIRQRCPDIIVNTTTGGDLTMTMDERLCCLAAAPDVASLNLTPDMSRFRMRERPAPLPDPRPAQEIDACVPFTYGQIEGFARAMLEHGIKPELEIYHSGGPQVVRSLIAAGLVRPPYLVQTVMGTQTASYPTPEHLIQLVRDLPGDTVWLTSGIGPFQLPITTVSMLLGSHVRVGLEDNLYYRRGQLFTGNAEAVERVVRLADELQRPVATVAQARDLLALTGPSVASTDGATVGGNPGGG